MSGESNNQSSLTTRIQSEIDNLWEIKVTYASGGRERERERDGKAKEK